MRNMRIFFFLLLFVSTSQIHYYIINRGDGVDLIEDM